MNEHDKLKLATALAEVYAELFRAIEIFPTWPSDPLHAVSVLGEEHGELTRAILQTIYEPAKSDQSAVRLEAVQTAAMALRFLMHVDDYTYARTPLIGDSV